MEGKCGMQIRVLLVTRSYADAIYMKNLLPWEQLGFQLLIELNSISGLQKVTDLHPQVLMLFGSLGAADLDLFLEYSQKENLRLYIIILPNKQHQVDEPVTETANSGTAHLYFVPKLTDGHAAEGAGGYPHDAAQRRPQQRDIRQPCWRTRNHRLRSFGSLFRMWRAIFYGCIWMPFRF